MKTELQLYLKTHLTLLKYNQIFSLISCNSDVKDLII